MDMAEMVIAADIAAPPRAIADRLDRPSFDTALIVGTVALAVTAGTTAWIVPSLFVPLLLADLWGLGYQHVIATFTRLCCGQADRRAHRFLIYGLPPIVIVGVILMIASIGLWTVPTLYLYWQWFHYTRQSWGIAQIYRRKTEVADDGPAWLQKATFYAVPLWGILYRSASAPDRFLGMEFRALPVPIWLADAAGVVAIALTALWIAGRIAALRNGRLALTHTGYLASHIVIFLAGYCLIPSIDCGWLAINIWHNAQYILLVWLFNRNRFRAGVSSDARLLSWVVQPGRAWAYFGLCLAASTAVYFAFNQAAAAIVAATALPAYLILFQSVNFHHYVVDSVIWKIRHRKLRETLAIAD
jgi:hypothetical protein